ncbi:MULTISPECIES: hypothetical protein [unclassified Clostridioides]|uniref:hypothetical protein n=1 Tax=unclassified Clostridioides TaxID=2635829 RepID=UPI001D10567E|nr:hypothetical protein [Clostridioides sp. ZZV14-6150]MCC0718173.1 hypothetical protein [Clostridioides sp. ZZV14-6105]MCC0721514.1 hypothetical protein [Clostridioides sp. ZZV14-6104]MCC0728502.1 hypothetical protein [Clostridioides sp. ZZV14-6045]MCC0731923.1 hypothetical protein [Clostridioides sp. ZZV14-6048]MCC0735641.1 hypothetical protein [Clostridioides sp. ZZV14-6009]MCC0743846.1 hypothetical protein [Clostridioides sp. ZZV14-6044]MCC0752603.1 hypothetical protein [Clostridioides s
MKKLKIISILSLVMSTISAICGIGVVTYYVDNLFIRGLSVFILIMSACFVSSTTSLIFKNAK